MVESPVILTSVGGSGSFAGVVKVSVATAAVKLPFRDASTSYLVFPTRLISAKEGAGPLRSPFWAPEGTPDDLKR